MVDSKNQIHQLCSRITGASFAIRYWDGEEVNYGPGPIEFTVILKSRRAINQLFGNLKLRLAEAYTDGEIEVEGDLQQFVRLGFLAEAPTPVIRIVPQVLLAAISLWRRNSLRRARLNATHHYDLGNTFFKLWLDQRMVYSCAYFRQPDDDIDRAQAQKLDYLCAKLQLSPGDRLLDVGCGWGAFAIHAARSRGVQAVGITLSEEQVSEGRTRIAKFGLGQRVELRLQDYREMPEVEAFDKIASVGMFEHVGRRHILDYFRTTARLLKPGGRGVLHTIGRMRPAPLHPWIRKHIFPGAYVPSLGELVNGMAACKLNVIDLENLRLHYGYTLDRWAAAFERHVKEIQKMFDDRFVRMWRLYLHSSAAAFRHGPLNLWQIVFSKGLVNDLPLTREYMYS